MTRSSHVPPAGRAVPESPDTRERILRAAERVLATKGPAGATTREIAREAGCADGTLYVHFGDRSELFLALMEERLPVVVEPLRRLPSRVGRRTVRTNLREVAEAALRFHHEMLPMFAGLLAEPALLEAYRCGLCARNGGPHRGLQAISGYLEAEQRIGRIAPAADTEAVAAMLLFSCFGYEFSQQFASGERSAERDRRFVEGLTKEIARALAKR